MSAIVLELDLGERTVEARRFKREHPDLPLAAFLKVYPARFLPGDEPSRWQRDMPLAEFIFQPITVAEPRTGGEESGVGASLRGELDQCWREEQQADAACTSYDDPLAYPVTISDNEAVRYAYRSEMDSIADYLSSGLSVLVRCDKMLTEYIYEFVCHQAGRQVVLDTEAACPAAQTGVGSRLDQAIQGGHGEPLAHLPVLLHNLKNNEVLVLRSLDMLESPPLVELLYQRTGKGEKAQILAFIDPSLEVKKVLTDRFAVHVPIMGLPRYPGTDTGNQQYTVSRLITHKERQCFQCYDPEGLYKNVSGLHAIQFRNAMRYVGAKVAPQTAAAEVYHVIRQFKISSSGGIEIPDTTFADIGGYDHIKQKLKHTIELIAGPIAGLDEKHRKQLIPRGFVFHGPPGTGKTLFAKAVANELNATIQMVSGPEIMDKYVGQSENNLRQLFATARRNAPAVIFFDEFDSIASQRSTYADGGARANNAVVAQLLTELDGFQTDQTVLVIGTTNRIDIIDEALLRPSRLQPLEIGLPDLRARRQVADLHARGFGVRRQLLWLCELMVKHLKSAGAEESANGDSERFSIFLTELLSGDEAAARRFARETDNARLLTGLPELFAALGRLLEDIPDGQQAPVLDDLYQRFLRFGRRHGLELEDSRGGDQQPAPAEPDATLAAEIRELFSIVRHEAQGGVSPESFYQSLIDLVAEHTEQFNNDELRAVFQEASLEQHLEGRIITPRYLGCKVAQIRDRRQQHQRVHLLS
ncbi:MAG: 26S protease regulatory subunit [Deltaproteobacteria bacterium]|nr:26S protease regulatory subunit [Candidatus Anaeroferrophillus wilburensis]MBN2890166.1 26S protease regulatory subunit [Deltaproteobacteria bacterium]